MPAAGASTRSGSPRRPCRPPTLISLTVPARDGTSIVALSDSSSTSGSSLATVSPAFTSTLITGTSLKSPMSGTFTSSVPPPAAVPARRRSSRGGAGSRAAGSARPRRPCRPLDPDLLDGAAAGRHLHRRLVRLELDQRVVHRVSPGFTITLMTGTSLKSPMSGTFTSIVAMCVSPSLVVTRCAGWIFAGSIAYFA